MAYDPRLAVKFAAFAAGLCAQSNGIDWAQIDRLERAALDLPEGRLRAATTRFVTQLREARHDPVRLDELGRSMCAYIDTLNMPEVAQDRSDIDG